MNDIRNPWHEICSCETNAMTGGGKSDQVYRNHAPKSSALSVKNETMIIHPIFQTN